MTIDQLIAELQRWKEEGVSGDTEVVNKQYYEGEDDFSNSTEIYAVILAEDNKVWLY